MSYLVDADKDKSIESIVEELQQRRSSSLRPTTKFLKYGKWKQSIKIKEEVTEFFEIFDLLNQFASNPKPIGYDSAMLSVLEELVDIQTACETMMAILGADEQKRNEIRRQVIEKNAKRWYYEEEVK